MLLFFKRERKEEIKRETLICCSTYPCIHLLLLVCVLTGDRTHKPCVSGQCSNLLSYLASTMLLLFDSHSKSEWQMFVLPLYRWENQAQSEVLDNLWPESEGVTSAGGQLTSQGTRNPA